MNFSQKGRPYLLSVIRAGLGCHEMLGWAMEEFIRNYVPLSQTMGLSLLELSFDRIRLGFPAEPNLNGMNVVFGGSQVSGAALACWAWMFHHLKEEGIEALVVLKDCKSSLKRPVTGDYEVVSEGLNAKEWKEFLVTLREKGQARLQLSAQVIQNREVKATYEGRYVAKL